jgi:hypothetical protein
MLMIDWSCNYLENCLTLYGTLVRDAYLNLKFAHVADESHHLAAAAAVMAGLLPHQLQLLVGWALKLNKKKIKPFLNCFFEEKKRCIQNKTVCASLILLNLLCLECRHR